MISEVENRQVRENRTALGLILIGFAGAMSFSCAGKDLIPEPEETEILPLAARLEPSLDRDSEGGSTFSAREPIERGRISTLVDRQPWDCLHQFYSDEFVGAPGFGFSRLYFPPPPQEIAFDGKKLKVVSVRLIGLQEEAPLVYESPFAAVPINRQDLKHAISRELTDRERSRLARLEEGAPWVLERENLPHADGSAGGGTVEDRFVGPAGTSASGAQRIEFTGALWATAECLRCHEVEAGELLGALDYSFAPADSSPVGRPQDLGEAPPDQR